MSWDQMSWDQMSWDQMSWDQMSWDQTSWDQMSWDQTSWDQTSGIKRLGSNVLGQNVLESGSMVREMGREGRDGLAVVTEAELPPPVQTSWLLSLHLKQLLSRFRVKEGVVGAKIQSFKQAYTTF